MKCKKILASVMVMGLIASGLTTAVSAADLSSAVIDTVEPAYAIANEAVSRLTISGTTATCYSSTRGNATSISVIQVLEVQSKTNSKVWKSVIGGYWTKSVKANNIDLRNKVTGLESGTYRLKSEFTLTAKDGTTETITVYSQQKTI